MNTKIIMDGLRIAEWGGHTRGPGSGPMFSGGDGVLVRACPACRGIDPSDKFKNDFIEEVHGHRPDCKIKRAIDELAKEL